MIATTSTGVRVLRISRLACLIRLVSRSTTASNSRVARVSRRGSTTSSMNAGSDASSMKAFAGQAEWQVEN